MENLKNFLFLFQLLAGLGCVIFEALDFSIEEDEERSISPQLERILHFMIQRGKFLFGFLKCCKSRKKIIELIYGEKYIMLVIYNVK